MMNEPLKARWLEALRSGRYKQGRGLLRSSKDKYCCLGVLCNIIDPRKWRQSSIGPYYWDDDCRFIFGEALRTSGLDGGMMEQLAALNDCGFSFERIADQIEAHL
jgi:hypothetical protein